MATTIELQEVSKTYTSSKGGPVRALEATLTQIHPGEFYSLVGPSGCGKTTVLKLVAGLLAPTDGSIKIGDRIVAKPDPSVGVVFQKPTLLRWLTVLENVLLPATVNRARTAEVEARAQELLVMTGIEAYAHRYPSQLSGGMQQRAAIARALVTQPDVVLMDEPFSALDEFTRETLQDELLRIWGENPMTILFITHNISEAVYLSDRVGVMASSPGRLVDELEVDLPRPRHEDVRTSTRFFEVTTHVRSHLDGVRTSDTGV